MKWCMCVNKYTNESKSIELVHAFTFQIVGRCRLDGLEQVNVKELVFVVLGLFAFVLVHLTSSDETDLRLLDKHWAAVADESIESIVSGRASSTVVPCDDGNCGLLDKVAVGGADGEALID